jgi:hypothetical protein
MRARQIMRAKKGTSIATIPLELEYGKLRYIEANGLTEIIPAQKLRIAKAEALAAEAKIILNKQKEKTRNDN